MSASDSHKIHRLSSFFHPRMLARCRHRYDEAMRKMFCFWHEHKRKNENPLRRAATNTNATNFRVECCQTKLYVLASLEFFFLIASRFVSVSANVIFITFFLLVAFSLVSLRNDASRKAKFSRYMNN